MADPTNPIEVAARAHCANLLRSETAALLPLDLAEGFAIVAFTLGAAWALERHDMIELANAQMDSMRARVDGSIS